MGETRKSCEGVSCRFLVSCQGMILHTSFSFFAVVKGNSVTDFFLIVNSGELVRIVVDLSWPN